MAENEKKTSEQNGEQRIILRVSVNGGDAATGASDARDEEPALTTATADPNAAEGEAAATEVGATATVQEEVDARKEVGRNREGHYSGSNAEGDDVGDAENAEQKSAHAVESDSSVEFVGAWNSQGELLRGAQSVDFSVQKKEKAAKVVHKTITIESDSSVQIVEAENADEDRAPEAEKRGSSVQIAETRPASGRDNADRGAGRNAHQLTRGERGAENVVITDTMIAVDADADEESSSDSSAPHIALK